MLILIIMTRPPVRGGSRSGEACRRTNVSRYGHATSSLALADFVGLHDFP